MRLLNRPLPDGLRALRRRQSWTQARLASALNVDTVTVSRWERGICEPRADALSALRNLAGPSSATTAPKSSPIAMNPGIDELVRIVGVDVARKALRALALARKQPRSSSFPVDPARRLAELDVMLAEQRGMIDHARIE